jgi:hypothetical protein
MKRRFISTIAATSAVLGFAGFASAANASAAPAATPSWHTVYSLAENGEFDGVVATGKTTGFAFFDSYTTVATPVAYQRTGATTFKKVPFTAVANEWVVGAGGTSSSDVYVFADIENLKSFKPESEVLKWTGKKFSVVATFSGELGGGTVLSADNVFAYGSTLYGGLPSAGIYHYNGHKWTKLPGAISGGGDALSATSAYVVSGTSIHHYNGTTWTTTNLASLLPARGADLTGVLALSTDSIYATGDGGANESAGPAVILHYNGHKWSKVVSYRDGSADGEPASDGKGGLWVAAGESGASVLLHYSGGKLTTVATPEFDGSRVTVFSISRIPGTTGELAGGVVLDASGKSYHPPVILQSA